MSGFWVIEKAIFFLNLGPTREISHPKIDFGWIYGYPLPYIVDMLKKSDMGLFTIFFKLYSYIKDTISIMWILVKVNLLSWWLSLVIGRLPSNTWILTVFRLSAAVEKIWDFLVGITVLQEIILHYKGQQLQELNPYLLIWNLVHCCLILNHKSSTRLQNNHQQSQKVMQPFQLQLQWVYNHISKKISQYTWIDKQVSNNA